MKRNEIMKKVTEIFRDVFDDNSILLRESTTAENIKEWDSLSHIILIGEIERAFNFRFAMKDVTGMKNIGEMLDILSKTKEE